MPTLDSYEIVCKVNFEAVTAHIEVVLHFEGGIKINNTFDGPLGEGGISEVVEYLDIIQKQMPRAEFSAMLSRLTAMLDKAKQEFDEYHETKNNADTVMEDIFNKFFGGKH